MGKICDKWQLLPTLKADSGLSWLQDNEHERHALVVAVVVSEKTAFLLSFDVEFDMADYMVAFVLQIPPCHRLLARLSGQFMVPLKEDQFRDFDGHTWHKSNMSKEKAKIESRALASCWLLLSQPNYGRDKMQNKLLSKCILILCMRK